MPGALGISSNCAAVIAVTILVAGSAGRAQTQNPASREQTPRLTMAAETPRNLVMAGRVLDDGRIALEAGGEGESVLIGETITAIPVLDKEPVGFLNGFAGRSGLFIARGSGDGDLDVRAYASPDTWLYSSTVWPYQFAAISRDGATLARLDRRATSGRTVAVQLSNLYFPASMPNGMAADKETAIWKLVTDANVSVVANADFFYSFGQKGLLVAVDRFSGTVHRYDTTKQTELSAIPLPDPRPNGAQMFQFATHFVSAAQLSADGTAVAVSQPEFGVRVVRLSDGAIVASTKPDLSPDAMAPLTGGGFLLATEDGRLLRWNGGEPVELARLTSGVSHIVPLETKKLVAVASADGVNHLLDLDSGGERMILLLDGKDQWALVAPDGRFDASDFGAKGLGWSVDGATLPFEDFADDLATPGLSEELITGKYETTTVKLAQKERRLPALAVSAQPAQQGTRAKVTLTLHASAGVEIRNPRLKRNGVMVKEWEGTYKDGAALGDEVDLVTGIDNVFTAYAYNQDNVKSEDAKATLHDTGKPIRPGELWVIAVGINEYENPIFNLHYAVNDARLAAWSLAVQRQSVAEAGKIATEHPMRGYEGKTILNDAKHFIDMHPSMGPAHVKLLLNLDATRAGILGAIRDYAAKARPEDTFVVFFAGHGVAVDKRYYMLPHDLSFSGNPSELSAAPASALLQSAISDVDLRQALSTEQASTAALLLDACQSGALTGDSPLERRGPMDSEGLRQLAYDKDMYLLAASLSTQSAAEQASIEDGVLTYTLFQRGLLDDASSTTTTPAGPGPVLLGEWLGWATRSIQLEPGTVLERMRGFGSSASTAQKQTAASAHSASSGVAIQQPRLFAPPRDLPIIVAMGAATLDPLTVATQLPPGTEGAPVETVPGLPAPSSGTTDNSIALKDFETLGLRPNSLGALSSGRLRPDGRTMVAIRNGGVAEIDLVKARLLWTRSLPDTARACDMTAKGELACISASGRVFELSASVDSTVTQIAQLSGIDGASLIHWLNGGNLLAVRGQLARVLRRDGTIVKSLDQPTTQFPFPNALAFDEKSERLFLYGWEFDKAGQVITSFDVPSFTAGSSEPMAPAPDSTGIAGMAISPGGGLLVILDFDGRVTVRNLRSGSAMKLPGELTDGPAQGPATAVAFLSVNELLVALAGGTVLHVDPGTGTVTDKDQSAAAPILEIVQQEGVQVRAGIGPEGSLAVWRGMDTEAGSVVPGGRYLMYLAFAADGRLQALMETENRLRLFSLPGPAALHEAQIGVPGILKWRSGGFLAFGSGARLLRWDPETLEVLAPVDIGTANHFAEGAEISPDGAWAAWIEQPKLSADVDVAAPAPVAHVKNLTTGAELTLPNSGGVPKEVFFTPDSRSLAVFTMPETMSIIDVSGGVTFVPLGSIRGKAYRIPGLPSGMVRFDTNARTMLALSTMSGDMWLCDLFHGDNGKMMRRETLTSMPSVVELDTNGKHAVIGMMDGSVMWWDTSAKPVSLPALSAAIVSVAFRPDGNGFAAGSTDGTIAWFHTPGSGAPVLEAVTRWNEEGKTWVTTGRDGQQSISEAPVLNPQSGNAPDLLQQLVLRGTVAPR
jgi:uncharacterized caspase-like protein